MKLDEHDLALLELLGSSPRRPTELAAELPAPEGVEDRLDDLVDNGLVDRQADGTVARTESGRRVLVATPAGANDDAIDTPPGVERVIATADLDPAEADAVRSAYALVRYWGDVTRGEVQDAVYAEAPAGYGDADAWWDDLVSQVLAGIPGVEPPTGDDDRWRYAGVPEAARDPDGRRTFDREDHPSYGSARHALESLSHSGAEREATRAAFGYLRDHGEATERELGERVYPDHPAGYPSAEEWLDGCVRDVFAALPGVERADGDAWRYRHPDDGSRHSGDRSGEQAGDGGPDPGSGG